MFRGGDHDPRFSSMAAILGGYGMGPYSAANRCMDATAHRLAQNVDSEDSSWGAFA